MFGNFFKKKTRTGMVASSLKNRKLKTRKEMKKLRNKLPPDYLLISEGTFAEMSQITRQVYLTGIFGLTKENFEDNGINDVINVSYEAPDIEIRGITYLRILVDDDPEEDLSPYFDTTADYIDAVVKRGGHTVVHCVAGVSRSAAVVLAYLIKYKNMSLRQAFKYVYDRRKCIKPIIGFIRQLIDFEKLIRGTNSCQIVKYKRDGVTVNIPDFWITDYPQIVNLDIEVEKNKLSEKGVTSQGSTIGNTNSKID